jgi:hypothetical protein
LSHLKSMGSNFTIVVDSWHDGGILKASHEQVGT